MSRHEDSDMFSLKKLEELLDTGTSFLPTLSRISEICNFILQTDIEPQLILTTIQKKFTSSNHLVSFVSVMLEELQNCMRNCGTLTPRNDMTANECIKKLKKLIKTECYAKTIPTSRNINRNKQNRASTSKCISSQSPFVIEPSTSFNNNGFKDTTITEALIYMICKDNMHTKTVENEGFLHLIKTLCPMYKMPSGSILTNLVQERCDAYFKRLLDQVNYMSLTVLFYSVDNLDSYASYAMVWSHFINLETSKLESYCMKAFEMTEITEENIVEALNMISEKCISPSQLVCMTVGSVSIWKSRRAFLHYPELTWCFAYMTNAVVQNSLKKISGIRDIISKIRDIVIYCNNDNEDVFNELIDKQVENGTSEGNLLHLTLDDQVEWNTTLEMLEKFVKLQPFLLIDNECDEDDEPEILTEFEVEVVCEVIKLLAPFKEEITQISTDEHITGSIVLPLCYNVRETLNKLHPATRFAKDLKKNLLKEIEKKYVPYEENTCFVIATLLDPRFKKMYKFPPISEANAISQVCQEISDVANQQKSSLFSKQISSNTFQKDSNSIRSKRTENVKIYSEQMPQELISYFNSKVLPLSENPVSYWLNCKTYPALAQVALKYCTVMGSTISRTKLISICNSANEKNTTIPNYINKDFFLAHFTKNLFSH